MCEAAGSIRDRAPRIINQLREAQRSCGVSTAQVLVNTNSNALDWDETLARERVSLAGIESLIVTESIVAGPQTAAEAINHWLDINTDCQQLIASDVKRIGMACAIDERDNSGPYWSLLLAGPEP